MLRHCVHVCVAEVQRAGNVWHASLRRHSAADCAQAGDGDRLAAAMRALVQNAALLGRVLQRPGLLVKVNAADRNYIPRIAFTAMWQAALNSAERLQEMLAHLCPAAVNCLR